MRTFWFDLFFLSCIYLNVSLVLLLVGASLNLSNVFSLLVIPIAFFAVAGGGFLFGKFRPSGGATQRPVQLREVVAYGAKKKQKRSLITKKVVKPLQTLKPKIEFGFHTCPVHGIEKCAGNYLNLHSCNDTVQTSAKQIFWREITPALPAK